MAQKILVTARIDQDTVEKARLSKVSVTRALELGLDILLGGDVQEAQLLEERKELQTKIAVIEKQLDEIKAGRDDSESVMDKAKAHIQYLKETPGVLEKHPGALRARTRGFNNITGLHMSATGFQELVNRAIMGEFDNNGAGKPGERDNND